MTLCLSCLAGSLTVHCAPPTQCDQFSDCASGYTCAAGMCVLPPGAADAAADRGTVPDSSGAGDGARTDGSAAHAEAATGTDAADAMTSDGGHVDAASDAPSVDAPSGDTGMDADLDGGLTDAADDVADAGPE